MAMESSAQGPELGRMRVCEKEGERREKRVRMGSSIPPSWTGNWIRTHCSIRSMSTQFSSTLHSEVVGGSADATTVSHV